ncbi:MAG TPA: TIGR04013 family B12-binding domain/radical SAM domain-containing protein [Anaerolineae bacterium]|nr:TIGR04013 family B12-binding domain/radical SAM domain-containing protein [Anaerolineae bacterium]HOQ97375.1 TIGR04013 family B12-binding domain/radical SAM domain-containing protein [Anaerolineae bacterium]HPL27348.1 TIGR04013 family B12-binding domain/radical SAM domain-containing protein [Anaerolineae bacterium]
MLDLAVVLVGHRKNWNSLAALAGALEVDARLRELALHFARPGAPALAQVQELAARQALVVVGYSFMSPDLARVAAELAELRGMLREGALGNVRLVAGGPHATAAWQSTLALGFDYAVVGEGEAAFPELLCELAAGRDGSAVRGVAWRSLEGARVFNGRARPVSLADYPPFSARYRRQGPIEITRGCVHRCRFCATPFLAGRRLRHRPLGAVLAAVESCLREGVDQIRFIAPDSLAYGSADGRPRLDLLEALLRGASEMAGRANIFLGSFPSEVRPESVSAPAVELIARYCGNDNLVVGAQSGSARQLEAMRRGHTVADVRRAVKIIQGAGLRANVDIIFGLPGETAEDRELTFGLIDELAARGARIHSHTFLPLPGSPWATCPPGEVDAATARRLGALAGQGAQYGSWQVQAQQAREMVELMARLAAL